ncbi:peptidase M24, structural domain-containing protein [Lipomyces japonicus]|uniref:peptidase M24, structural domain-containing protein n=1 Tax=Lipomyces japonicus TaxID=56871 RepID=UPI0034CE3E4E
MTEAEIDYSLENPETLTKYKLAGDIAEKVLAQVKAAAVAGAKVVDVAALGDSLLLEGTAKVYNNKKGVSKGIAFPTAVSPNHVAAHLSPLAADDSVLQAGDVVKISLGAHIDGLAAVLADTVVVPGGEAVTEGKVADVFAAAWNASEAAVRLFRPGKKSSDVSDAVSKIARTFGVSAVEDTVSHQFSHNSVEAGKRIVVNPAVGTVTKASDVATFEPGEVYGIDVLVSTGDGKLRKSDSLQTTIYRKTESSYSLKLKASRSVYSDIQNRFGAFPFTTRALADDTKTKLALQECTAHNLLTPYDVYEDKKGEIVVEFFTTIAVTNNGIIKIAGPANFDVSAFPTNKKIEDEDLLKVISSALKPSSKNKKKKKANADKPAAEEK